MPYQLPKIVENDPWLKPYEGVIQRRVEKTIKRERSLLLHASSLSGFATGYLYFGLHRVDEGWVLREWAPNATSIFMVGEFNNWQEHPDYSLQHGENGEWVITLPADKLCHGQLYKLLIYWNGGRGFRIPAYAWRVIQHEETKVFDCQVWHPEEPFEWKHSVPDMQGVPPLIYEAHVGMAGEEERVITFKEFRQHVLPRVVKAGYNTLQLMAIQEHPYYGSFGYHVSNFFAVSSRFGTPEELKALIDEAHGCGLAVIMDIVHSHSVKNEMEGLALFDGSPGQYFHVGPRREHVAWDSLCFDYGKDEVLHFLLSNCKFWLDEYRFDGFRFDGVTSMLYYDHGLSRDFTHYGMYFDGGQDEDAITYISLANKLIHEVKPAAITIAEEMSGMPGLAEGSEGGGLGFDFRMAMGIPDYWIKIIKELPDERWNVSALYHELTSKRKDEKTIAYAESHDQALVGDKTIIFRLIDQEMYWSMGKETKNLVVDRGIALHKMIRMITLATAGGGYLNFMGNEFGHPEWIDFPREGNGWSYKYARRLWYLRDDQNLKYHCLADFDEAMISLIKQEKLLEQPWCHLWLSNDGDQVLAFSRKDYLFVFNFNPSKSFTDYGIFVDAGKYSIVLNTDSLQYGGFGLVEESVVHFTHRSGKLSSPYHIKLYIPSRTALVLHRMPTLSVYDV